ncbi:MAG TPA: hypothetical protein VGP47_09890 [Parachlamydiaceae bacterium]|nr:hypothetical protein [Parachlamydiaceae bacterium]
MDHHHLEAMMQGNFNDKKKTTSAPKSKTDIELDSQIDAYVDGLSLDDLSNQKSLISPEAKKVKMKLELKEAVKLPDLSLSLDSAMEILINEGSNYLSPEANQALLSAFSNAASILADMTLTDVSEINLQELSKFDDEGMNSIVTVAIAKYGEGKYADSESIFALLAILNPGYAEYWLRLGLAAQKNANLELASRAYTAAAEIDPDLIEARLFNAECLFACKEAEKALQEIDEAKKIAERIKVDQEWLDLLPIIESSIKQPMA